MYLYVPIWRGAALNTLISYLRIKHIIMQSYYYPCILCTPRMYNVKQCAHIQRIIMFFYNAEKCLFLKEHNLVYNILEFHK